MRFVTCSIAAALVLVVSAAAGGERDLVVPLSDGSMAFISAGGQLTGVVAARPAPGTFAAIRPVFSPDGTRVAFVQGGIVVAELDGTQHRLTTAANGGVDTEPTWSADGTQIAFRRGNGAREEVAVVPAAGGAVRALTTEGAYVSEPRWQPRGSKVLFASYQPEAGLYVVEAAGGTPKLVATGSGPAEWAPDGSAVARGGFNGLGLFGPDGAGARELVTNRNVTNVAWSPDGTRIAFTVAKQFPEYGSKFGTPTQYDVFAVGRDGSGLTRLTGFEADTPFDRPGATTPRWWPGGSRLFFKNGSEVWTMNADGTCEQRFETVLQLSEVPTWSPLAAAAPAVECTSAQLRLRARPTEVGLHDDVFLSVLVRNDGTRTLDGARLELAATRGVVRSTYGLNTCTRGREIVCTLGSLPPGAERTVEIVGTPGPTAGLVKYTAHVAWEGPQDVTPTADNAGAFVGVAPCDILGTWGTDYLVGTARAEHICARPGPDRIDGGAGDDWIEAGSGADTVLGGRGRDTIDGAAGGDLIYVRDGQRDIVDCGTEQDIVVGDQLDVVKHCERVTRVKTTRKRP